MPIRQFMREPFLARISSFPFSILYFFWVSFSFIIFSLVQHVGPNCRETNPSFLFPSEYLIPWHCHAVRDQRCVVCCCWIMPLLW
uniref:Uncharacterized protein n=1 Tax=Arundo donax TaxID=35708 RepID=A0A0A9CGR5_ARUDO